MKAFVFSIGESTTDLCCDLMAGMGFEVILFQDDTSLWDKLKRFYTEALATNEPEFVRIDADVIPNKRVKDLKNEKGWTCAWGWDWYHQDQGPISIHIMNRQVIQMCLDNIISAKDKIRPETHLWRIAEINPLTENTTDGMFGMHGYGQADHRQRIKSLKASRNQPYDWSLVEKIESL